MTKLNDAEALYLGSTPVDRVYKGSNRIWPPLASEDWESFDSGNRLSFGDIGSFERVTTSPFGGSHRLERNALNDNAYLQVWDENYGLVTPSPTFSYRGWVKTLSSYVTTGLTSLSLCTGGVARDGYQGLWDNRSTGSGGIRTDYNSNGATNFPAPASVEDWVHINVMWVAIGTIMVEIRANDNGGQPGTLIGSGSRSDSTYSSLYLGVGGYSRSAYDQLEFTP